jgi:hypothetical protein
VTHLGVRLQRATGLLVELDDDSVWITREIDPLVDDDLRHLLIDLRLKKQASRDVRSAICLNDDTRRCACETNLFLRLGLLDERLELARDVGDLVEEGELAIVKTSSLS